MLGSSCVCFLCVLGLGRWSSGLRVLGIFLDFYQRGMGVFDIWCFSVFYFEGRDDLIVLLWWRRSCQALRSGFRLYKICMRVAHCVFSPHSLHGFPDKKLRFLGK